MAFYQAIGASADTPTSTEHPFTKEALKLYTDAADSCVLVIDSFAAAETPLPENASRMVDEFAKEFNIHVPSHLVDKSYTFRSGYEGLSAVQSSFAGFDSTEITATLGGVTATVSTANKNVWTSVLLIGERFKNVPDLMFINENKKSRVHIVLKPSSKFCNRKLADIKMRIKKTRLVVIAFNGVTVDSAADVVLWVNDTAAFLTALRDLITERRVPQL